MHVLVVMGLLAALLVLLVLPMVLASGLGAPGRQRPPRGDVPGRGAWELDHRVFSRLRRAVHLRS